MNFPGKNRAFGAAMLALFSACGGSSSDGGNVTNPPGNGGGNVVTPSITIALTVPGDMQVGKVYARAGTTALGRADMTAADLKCGGVQGSRNCKFTATVGQTVTIVATEDDNLFDFGEVNASGTLPNPQAFGAKSQFASFGANCAGASVGVCSFVVAGDQTVAVTYKPLTLTAISFSGELAWQLTVTSPPSLALGAPNVVPVTRVTGFGAAGLPIGNLCIGNTVPPLKLCYFALTSAGSTLKLEMLQPAANTKPTNSPGPMKFIKWGGGCLINGTNPSCTLTSGADQSLIMYFEYYNCGGSISTGANLFWYLPPGVQVNCALQTTAP
jgi:hypothetical protein